MSNPKEKTKEEIIEEYLNETREDLKELEFGRITIYVDNGYPFRMEVQKSKKPKTLDTHS